MKFFYLNAADFEIYFLTFPLFFLVCNPFLQGYNIVCTISERIESKLSSILSFYINLILEALDREEWKFGS